YNELLYFVRMAKSLGFENILISSNARLFTYKDYCKKLIQAGANIFFISIFSGKEKIHDSITRVKGSWKQTISGIRNLARLSDGLYVNISILKYNYKTMPALVVRLSKLGVKRINFNMLRPEGQAEMDYGILTSKLADLRPYLNKIVNYRLFKNIFFSFYLVPFCLLNEYPNADEIKNMGLPDLEKWDNFENGFKKYNVKIKTYQMLMKLRLCRSCKLCKDCPGVMKEYVRLFGKKSVSAELSPFVKKNG
ncbi:MAG: hypothetical protein NTY47_07875, partial [Candidatus Omnitrophica bacterium]|nr:hypothetical protein [Candidatus Omnitrophota bacterium]